MPAGPTARGRGSRTPPCPGRRRRARPCRSTERRRGARAALADPLRDVVRLLDRDGREARQRPAVRALEAATSPITEISGWPGHRQVGVDLDAPAAVGVGAGRPGERVGERDGVHAGRPDHRPARRSARSPRRPRSSRRRASIAVARAPSRTVTPSSASSSATLRRELLAERRDHALAGVEQDHPRVARCRCARKSRLSARRA